ncbi:MAG: hypothetical protein FWE09_01930 [Treponema sp.]|nr:hypothetical protein [Treponema sp.]
MSGIARLAQAVAFALVFPCLALAQDAQAFEDEIMAIRGRLAAGGALAFFPELARPADQAAIAALDLSEAGDSLGARSMAEKSLAMFRALDAAFEAWQARERLARMDATGAEGFVLAEDLLEGAVAAYLDGNLALATEGALAAREMYGQAMLDFWLAEAQSSALMAQDGRIAALEEKANIAASELFARATWAQDDAFDLLHGGLYREAAEKFFEAEAMYFVAIVSTGERRRYAAQAIWEARARIEEAATRAAMLADFFRN